MYVIALTSASQAAIFDDDSSNSYEKNTAYTAAAHTEYTQAFALSHVAGCKSNIKALSCVESKFRLIIVWSQQRISSLKWVYLHMLLRNWE